MSHARFLSFCLFSPMLFAQGITVGPVGSGAMFPSVQAGILACPIGGTVTVFPGTYPESINFNGKAIHVVSQIPHQAILDMNGSQPPGLPPQPVVSFVNGEGRSSILEGFVVTGGASTQGGGVRCLGTSPILRNNLIFGNGVVQGITYGPGGGVYVRQGSPWLDHNQIVANQGTQGGGVYGLSSSLLLTDNALSNNVSLAEGGGLFAEGAGRHTLTRNSYTSNQATRGGGIALSTIRGAELSAETFTANSVVGSGGGIALLSPGAAAITISASQFTDNQANFDGGGLHCVNGTPTVTGCTFTHNFADRYGGGIHLFDRSIANVSSCRLIGGNTAWQAGGGIAIRDGSDAMLTDLSIDGSLANQRGGGIFIRDASPSIRIARLTGNGLAGTYAGFPISAADEGGGIAIEGFDTQTFLTRVATSGLSIDANFAEQAGAGIWFTNCEFEIRGSRLAGNGVDNSGTTPLLTLAGGGMHGSNALFRIEGNTLIRNEADDQGAGLSLVAAQNGSTLLNNMIVKNALRFGNGGGVFFDAGTPLVMANTIAQNTNEEVGPTGLVYGPGSGVFVNSGNGLVIANCIVRGTGTTVIDAMPGAQPLVTFCNVGGSQAGAWIPGPNVMNLLPRFVDPANDDFHIKPTSPCRDAGTTLPGMPTLDFDGQLRLQGPAVDIGADEVG